ncbi:MAG: hypothetical protein GX284_01195 [Clostridiales bacterium]|nr:hypothetical protein [Clostridiales bacterium]
MGITEQEIKNNIRDNEELIELYQSQKNEIEEQISSLECLKNKFITLQTTFGIKQDVRKAGLVGIVPKMSQIKIASRYYSGMNDLLNSGEFNNAYNSLSDAKAIIVREQDRLYTQLDDVTGKIYSREQRMEYWRKQLRNIRYR